MAADNITSYPTAPALLRWREREARIRDTYLAAVHDAQRQYDDDTKPALTAYQHAERAAWMTYMEAGRRNWADFRGASGSTPSESHPLFTSASDPEEDAR